MSLNTLRDELRSRAHRADTFRHYLRQLHRDDRDLFFRLARNRPGPGASIISPENHGFELISTFRSDSSLLREHVLRAREFASRESMFNFFIGLTHKLAPNFRIYVGRTFVREEAEHVGPRQRFASHYEQKRMRYAMPLARVPRSRVERDETLAIALIRLWEEYDALCCNNDVLSGRQPGLSDDSEQMIYMCLRRR